MSTGCSLSRRPARLDVGLGLACLLVAALLADRRPSGASLPPAPVRAAAPGAAVSQAAPQPATPAAAAGSWTLQRALAHEDAVRAVAFSPDGTMLASGGSAPQGQGADLKYVAYLRLWDARTGNLLRALNPPGRSTNCLAFSRTGLVACGGAEGEVTIWEPGTGRLLGKTAAHRGQVNSVSFSPDGGTLATTSSGSAVAPQAGAQQEETEPLKLWNARQPAGPLPLLRAFAASAFRQTGRVSLRAAFSPDGSMLALCNTFRPDQRVRFLDVRSGSIRVLEQQDEPIGHIAFSPDGRVLATAVSLGFVRLWDVASGRELRVLRTDTSAYSAVVFSPDGRVLATAAGDVRLWDPHTGELRETLRGRGGLTSEFAFSSTSRVLAAARVGVVEVWGAELPVVALDLNPACNSGRQLIDGSRGGPQLVPNLTPDELLALAEERQGAVADGASHLLIRARLAAAGTADFSVEGGDANGTCVSLTGTRSAGRTLELKGGNYAFALYTPPAAFGREGDGTQKLAGEVDSREVRIQVTLRSEMQPPLVVHQSLKLARPPVVLVHGTFDNAADCWQQPSPHGARMDQRLASEGFRVFMPDYRQSNGAGPAESGFVVNRRVVRENADGIQAAVRHFRDRFDLAATQADVVGHDLGGLLPRVFASDHSAYGAGQYRRPENFGKGDIHRLITIGTPHYGSDLPDVLEVLKEVLAPDQGLAARGAPFFGSWYFYFHPGTTVPGAARDLRVESPALRDIGPTAIPAHAIVSLAALPDLNDFGGVYRQRMQTIWQAFHKHPGLLKQFLKKRTPDEKTLNQQVDRLLGELARVSWLQGGDPQAGTPPPLGSDVAPKIEDQNLLMALLRAAVFGNTPNDCTVRAESQLGGLDLRYSTTIRRVLHSYAPRYRSVQDRVVELLEDDGRAFAPRGFPAAGQPLLNADDFAPSQPPEERRKAIAASNMVPSHAEAFAQVARGRSEVVFVRPINPDATRLIARSEATKGMRIKGKSADWGPQKGYIPRDQRFSKLKGRPAEIAKYNAKVEECLAAGDADPRELQVPVAGELYEVVVLEGIADPEKAIALRRPGEAQLYDWRTRDGQFDETVKPVPLLAPPPPGNVVAMIVLSDRWTRRKLTADYDLLAVGIRGPPGTVRFDAEMGHVTETQTHLINTLNFSVYFRGNYEGGNVVHHGPENQFPESPGVDYPVTVFEPDGAVLSIAEGPRGQRDVHLKRYFHRKKLVGWTLTPNPTSKFWNWEHYRKYDRLSGYDERDAPFPPPEEKENHFDSGGSARGP